MSKAKKSSAAKAKGTAWNPWAEVYEDIGSDGEVCWFVEYEAVEGRKNRMTLETDGGVEDAKAEASSATGIPVEDVRHP